MSDRSEGGFTLIEMLVTIALFAIVSVGFYQVLFASVTASNLTRSVVDVSEEARLGFNRLVRDTREGRILQSADGDSYELEVDYNGNGTIEPSPGGGADPEVLEFTFNPGGGETGPIRLNGEVLMRGVSCLEKADGTCKQDVFTYSSNRLEFDTNGDGVASSTELDDATGLGNGNGRLDGDELSFVTSVRFALNVTDADAEGVFVAEAQMRNQR